MDFSSLLVHENFGTGSPVLHGLLLSMELVDIILASLLLNNILYGVIVLVKYTLTSSLKDVRSQVFPHHRNALTRLYGNYRLQAVLFFLGAEAYRPRILLERRIWIDPFVSFDDWIAWQVAVHDGD